MKAKFQVKVVKCDGNDWYKGRIGQKFDIAYKSKFENKDVYITTGLQYLKIEDVLIIKEYPKSNLICRVCGYNKDIEETSKCSHCNTKY